MSDSILKDVDRVVKMNVLSKLEFNIKFKYDEKRMEYMFDVYRIEMYDDIKDDFIVVVCFDDLEDIDKEFEDDCYGERSICSVIILKEIVNEVYEFRCCCIENEKEIIVEKLFGILENVG